MSTSHENALGRYLLTWTTDNRRPDGRRVAEGRDPAASPRKSWAPGAASTRRAPDCRAAPAAGTAGSDSHVLFHKDKISIRRRLWSGSPGRLSLSLSLSLSFSSSSSSSKHKNRSRRGDGRRTGEKKQTNKQTSKKPTRKPTTEEMNGGQRRAKRRKRRRPVVANLNMVARRRHEASPKSRPVGGNEPTGRRCAVTSGSCSIVSCVWPESKTSTPEFSRHDRIPFLGRVPLHHYSAPPPFQNNQIIMARVCEGSVIF